MSFKNPQNWLSYCTRTCTIKKNQFFWLLLLSMIQTLYVQLSLLSVLVLVCSCCCCCPCSRLYIMLSWFQSFLVAPCSTVQSSCCCLCPSLALVAVLVLAFFLLHAVLVLISPNYCRYKSSYSYIGSWGLSVSCPCLVLAIAPVLACVLAWCFALFLVLFHVLVLILLQVILPNKTTIYFVQNRILHMK